MLMKTSVLSPGTWKSTLVNVWLLQSQRGLRLCEETWFLDANMSRWKGVWSQGRFTGQGNIEGRWHVSFFFSALFGFQKWFDPVLVYLQVKIYMGEGWHKDFKQTHFDSYSPPDFYVKVCPLPEFIPTFESSPWVFIIRKTVAPA